MKQICLLVACGAMLTLSSCSFLHLKKSGTTEQSTGTNAKDANGDKTKASDENRAASEEGGAPVPTAAQQAAAHDMMEGGTAPAGVATEPVDNGYTPTGVPGGRGLRMGTIAPPEEAASTGDGAEPRPNSAERRGLRTPPLPSGLPMDMDGKLTPEATH